MKKVLVYLKIVLFGFVKQRIKNNLKQHLKVLWNIEDNY